MLGTATTLLAAPLLPATASACGSYGAFTPEDRAHEAAAFEHYRLDSERWLAARGSVQIEDDLAKVRLVLEDREGRRFDRTMHLALVDGEWSVTRAGTVRLRRRTA